MFYTVVEMRLPNAGQIGSIREITNPEAMKGCTSDPVESVIIIHMKKEQDRDDCIARPRYGTIFS